MKKRKNKKVKFLIGSLLILFGIITFLFKNFVYYYLDTENNYDIDYFFENTTSDNQETENIVIKNNKKKSNNYYNNYIGVLEIPSISLKRGFVDKNNPDNKVNKNIQILKESDMPDVENGTLYLASHSGSSYVSFFKKLYKVNIGDYIYVYYKGIKYTYEIQNIYEEVKDGDIKAYRNNKLTSLILTTCNQSHKGYQLIVVSKLLDKSSY